jgi:hypothetical protein
MKKSIATTNDPVSLAEILLWHPTSVQRKNAIIVNYLRGAEAYLIVGKLLCEAHQQEDWKKDGSEAKNFNEWIEKELTIKRSNANRMMQIWTVIGPLLPAHQDLIRRIDFSKLAMIMPVLKKLKDEQQVLEWLHMAETNTVRDLENNLRERGHKGTLSPSDTCNHLRTQPWLKCLQCNAFIRDNRTNGDRSTLINALKTAQTEIIALHGVAGIEEYRKTSAALKEIEDALKGAEPKEHKP